MPTTVTKSVRRGNELVVDMEVSGKTLVELMNQAYNYIAQREGVTPAKGQSLQEAVNEKLTEAGATTLVTNAVMNMAAPFGRSAVEDVTTVGSPLFESHSDLDINKVFTFRSLWALLPVAELDSYDPVEIEIPSQEVSEEEIDQQIDNIRMQHASNVPSATKTVVEKGDTLTLKLFATLQGQEIEGLCFDERVYATGVGNMPLEFEQNIIGMKVGETKSFTFEGLADFDEEGQPIMEEYGASATVLNILDQQMPALTDEWVKATVQGCNNVQQLRDTIASQMTAQTDEERRHYINYVAASALAERFNGPIPDEAYEAIRDELKAQFNMEAARQNMTPEEYMEAQGMNEQQFGVRMVLQARERLAQSIALDAYARHFKIKVTEADLKAFYEASAGAAHAADLRVQLEGSGRAYLAQEGARRLKANDHLVARAIITEKSTVSASL